MLLKSINADFCISEEVYSAFSDFHEVFNHTHLAELHLLVSTSLIVDHNLFQATFSMIVQLLNSHLVSIWLRMTAPEEPCQIPKPYVQIRKQVLWPALISKPWAETRSKFPQNLKELSYGPEFSMSVFNFSNYPPLYLHFLVCFATMNTKSSEAEILLCEENTCAMLPTFVVHRDAWSWHLLSESDFWWQTSSLQTICFHTVSLHNPHCAHLSSPFLTAKALILLPFSCISDSLGHWNSGTEVVSSWSKIRKCLSPTFISCFHGTTPIPLGWPQIPQQVNLGPVYVFAQQSYLPYHSHKHEWDTAQERKEPNPVKPQSTAPFCLEAKVTTAYHLVFNCNAAREWQTGSMSKGPGMMWQERITKSTKQGLAGITKQQNTFKAPLQRNFPYPFCEINTLGVSLWSACALMHTAQGINLTRQWSGLKTGWRARPRRWWLVEQSLVGGQ